MDDIEAVRILKAVADPTRLRMLRILATHELNVSDLVQVLAQSQPRVSRHLRLLSEVGLVRRQSEGSWAYYRIDRDREAWPLVAGLVDQVDEGDAEARRIADRLDALRAKRRDQAQAWFREHAREWEIIRGRHLPDSAVDDHLVDLVAAERPRRLLDLGTGTGHVLCLAAPHVERGIGVDLSSEMLAVARERLEAAGHHHCEVRSGDVTALPLDDDSTDVAVLHHVLHHLDEPVAALTEASRAVVDGGLVIVVDLAPHGIEELRTELHHRRPGFADDEMTAMLSAAGLEPIDSKRHDPAATTPDGTPAAPGSTGAAVVVWTARTRQHASRGDGPTLPVAAGSSR